jgi:hypothetical protein
LGHTNEAGRELLDWCAEQGLVWANSFFRHGRRGTWWDSYRRRWHEIDGFVVRRHRVHTWVTNVTSMPRSECPGVSDHVAKRMTIRLHGQHGRARSRRAPQVRHERLRDPAVLEQFQQRTEQAAQQWNEGTAWARVNADLLAVAREVCGEKEGTVESPWMVGREEESRYFQQQIRRLSEQIEDEGCPPERVAEYQEERRTVRRQWKRRLVELERLWWEGVIEEAKEAEGRGDFGCMYRLLRRLGMRGWRGDKASDKVTVEQFRQQFMGVSAARFERRWAELEAIVEELPEEMEEEKRQACEDLGQPITDEEVMREWRKVKDGAPGEDGVRMAFIKKADAATQAYIAGKVRELSETEPDTWDQTIKTGLVVPLFKKGDRADPKNYRGICLLSLATRLLARVLASRLRRWAEAVGVMGEWQQGFRAGRSTADAAQMFFRLQEELQREYRGRTAEGNRDGPEPEDPVAYLLDLEKAYPRVNRPLMWAILERLGAPVAVIRTLKGLHEETSYRVRGKTGLSEPWLPQRGLREGCATSPILFNVYHGVAVVRAERAREAAAAGPVGIPWQWQPGHSLPPRDTRRALRSQSAQQTRLVLSLFADDTTVCGQRGELEMGKGVFVEALGEAEEKSNAAKEERMEIGEAPAGQVRMLGSYTDRTFDLKQRIGRVRRSWWAVKRRLAGSRLSKRTQARVVEACVEATGLFDAGIRPWHKRELRRLQSEVDRCYRFVWVGRHGREPLRRMEERGMNMWAVRDELGVKSISLKVEKRVLERVGHVLRMPNTRQCKQIVLGWYPDCRRGPAPHKGGQSTISFWRTVIGRMGVDPDLVEEVATDRKRWKAICRQRIHHIEEWEKGQAARVSGPRDLAPESGGLVCTVPGCTFHATSRGGLKLHHVQIHRRDREQQRQCHRCGLTVANFASLKQHLKRCLGAARGMCPFCHRSRNVSSMARHKKTCAARPVGGVSEPPSLPSEGKKQCGRCGRWVARKNLARHRRGAVCVPTQVSPQVGVAFGDVGDVGGAVPVGSAGMGGGVASDSGEEHPILIPEVSEEDAEGCGGGTAYTESSGVRPCRVPPMRQASRPYISTTASEGTVRGSGWSRCSF